MVKRILRILEVRNTFGQSSKQTVYNRVHAGLLTPPVPLGPRMVGWPEEEIAAIASARCAGATDDEIRALVAKLKAERQNAANDPASRKAA